MANTPMFTKSPIPEHEQEGNDYSYEEDPSSSNGCGCLQVFSIKYWQSNGAETRSLLNQRGDQPRKENWVVEKFKEAKEYSELVAGPRWKTSIRKLSGYVKSKRSQRQFQYDAESYALNFDGGLDLEEHEGLYRNGSSRFPPTPLVDAIKNLR